MLEYVGLETFTSRPYLKDIVRSDTFAYKNIIENGDFTTDISFTGQGKTVDMDKALR